jgi:SAM-dependent methyltransferase
MHSKPDIKLASECSICGSPNIHYRFLVRNHSLYQCADCDFMFLNPQPSDAVLNNFRIKDADRNCGIHSVMKKATARLYLKQLIRYCGKNEGNLLEIGCGEGEFLIAAKQAGFKVQGIDISQNSVDIANAGIGEDCVRCENAEEANLPEEFFDACVLFDVIEHVRNPIKFLDKIYTLLAPGGTLFLITPSCDSWAARIMKSNWMEFKPEHFHYFNKETIRNALSQSGFGEIYLSPNEKYLHLEYIKDRLEERPIPFYSKALRWITRCLPSSIKSNNAKYSTSRMNVLCRKKMARKAPVLSIIVPAYNEAKTFGELMRSLLDLKIKGVQKEILIIESNSTDGTRALAQEFSKEPGVVAIFEDRPKGKGHAVRNGLEHAGGDFVLIQDADLEYDLNDYSQLIEPLLRYQKAFVLGSRHMKGWKMRQFENASFTAFVMNLGQSIFKWLLNVVCGQNLNDPFTMYKVFRRDCLSGLTLRANRFDFDFEIVIKLLRKGYVPLEIPVNYKSRSFDEGKKISFARDPILWIRALAVYRLERLYKIRYEKDL